MLHCLPTCFRFVLEKHQPPDEDLPGPPKCPNTMAHYPKPESGCLPKHVWRSQGSWAPGPTLAIPAKPKLRSGGMKRVNGRIMRQFEGIYAPNTRLCFTGYGVWSPFMAHLVLTKGGRQSMSAEPGAESSAEACKATHLLCRLLMEAPKPTRMFLNHHSREGPSTNMRSTQNH